MEVIAWTNIGISESFPNLKRLTNLPAIRGVAMLSGLVKLTTMLIELGD